MTDENIYFIKNSHINNIEGMQRKICKIKYNSIEEIIFCRELENQLKKMSNKKYQDILSLKEDYYFGG